MLRRIHSFEWDKTGQSLSLKILHRNHHYQILDRTPDRTPDRTLDLGLLG